MKYATIVLVLVGLAGCAASVASTNGRSVTVSANSWNAVSAQDTADAECGKQNKVAVLRGKASHKTFVYDCVSQAN